MRHDFKVGRPSHAAAHEADRRLWLGLMQGGSHASGNDKIKFFEK